MSTSLKIFLQWEHFICTRHQASVNYGLQLFVLFGEFLSCKDIPYSTQSTKPIISLLKICQKSPLLPSRSLLLCNAYDQLQFIAQKLNHRPYIHNAVTKWFQSRSSFSIVINRFKSLLFQLIIIFLSAITIASPIIFSVRYTPISRIRFHVHVLRVIL